MFIIKYIHFLFLILLHSIICRFWLQVFIGLKIRNRRHLRLCDQFVLIANHNSHLDSLALLASLPLSHLKRVRVVAAADYFGKYPLLCLLTRFCFNALLIKRKGCLSSDNFSSIKLIQGELEKGNSIIFFPEGSRGVAEEISPFKKGIGHILRDYKHIPVIMAYGQGLGKCLPKGSCWMLPLGASLEFGFPFYCKANDPRMITRELWHALHKMEQKNALENVAWVDKKSGLLHPENVIQGLSQLNEDMLSKAS